MVFPLTALFFGTGNQTPNVSSAVIARVFLDPDLRLFDYDPKLLLSQTPKMFAFKRLGDIYSQMAQKLNTETGRCRVFTSRPVKSIQRVDSEGEQRVLVLDTEGRIERFDHVVLACDAETALRVLDSPSRMEKFVLGNVRYFDDVTLTHWDHDYMSKNYDLNPKRGDQYFIRTDPSDPQKIEMSFDLTNYQPQFTTEKKKENSQNTDSPRVYQTIFLNAKECGSWTIQNIDEKKVVLKKWWRQFAHTWRHFAFTVPFIRFLQGQRNTWFCGSYTLFNTHEIAVISGLAVAHRLGASYPFAGDKLAVQQFNTYMNIAHGTRGIVDATTQKTSLIWIIGGLVFCLLVFFLFGL